MKKQPKVAIVMGSDSDLPIMQQAANVLKEFDIEYEIKIISAHRTPGFIAKYTSEAHKRGIKVIIAGSSGSTHLPGITASFSPLPVIGVPIKLKTMNGIDSIISLVRMSSGIPLAIVSINDAKNAALIAIKILGLCDKKLFKKIIDYRKQLADDLIKKNKELN